MTRRVNYPAGNSVRFKREAVVTDLDVNVSWWDNNERKKRTQYSAEYGTSKRHTRRHAFKAALDDSALAFVNRELGAG